jgi:predicted nucleotidyltransferase
MQNESLTSVTVTFLDRDRCIELLKRCASALRQSNPKVRDIILVGSLVRSTYVPGSDADLLIVLSADHRRSIDRIPEFLKAFSGVPIAVDVFPLTKKELQDELQRGNALLSEALEEGMWLVGNQSALLSALGKKSKQRPGKYP